MEPPFQIDRPSTGVLFRRKDRVCPRSAHLPRRAFAKPEKLFVVFFQFHVSGASTVLTYIFPARRSQQAEVPVAPK